MTKHGKKQKPEKSETKTTNNNNNQQQQKKKIHPVLITFIEESMNQ